MPKAAPAAGTGTPVAGDHSNAMELASPVEEESLATPIGETELGSHRDEETDDTPAQEDDDTTDDAAIPARLKGKTLTQVYSEFAGLEREYSRQGNELGEARGLLRHALQQALKQPDAKSTATEEPDPTDDDFDTNPREAVSRLVRKELKPVQEAAATAEQRAIMLDFDRRHPGYMGEAASPEFQDWVKASPYRLRTFKAASEFDLDAAEDLFAAWEERKTTQKPAEGEEDPAKQKREAIKRQKTITGGAGKTADGKSGKKIYKSSELARLYTQDRERYNAMAEEIRIAFAEGRVR